MEYSDIICIVLAISGKRFQWGVPDFQGVEQSLDFSRERGSVTWTHCYGAYRERPVF